jgi:cellobiose transport system permease protein
MNNTSPVADASQTSGNSNGRGGRRTAAPSPWRADAQPGAPRKRKKTSRDEAGSIRALNPGWGYIFTAPFFIMFLIFGLAPVVYSTYIAFFNWDPLELEHPFVGLDNFALLLDDGQFWMAVGNTFSIWFFSTIPAMIMSIGLAAILRNPNLRGATFWRTILLVPNITSVLAIAIIFGQLFGRDFGLINLMLDIFGFDRHIDWITEQIPSHIAIATMITWRWVGYNSLIFLAAMLAIPNELYESASLDGASKWQTFRFVTLPQLRNTITFVLIVGTIGGLQVFAEPLTLGGNFNGGDSRQFSTLTLFLYEQAFVNNKWGYAAAVGIMITLIVLVISAINFWLTRRIASEDAK